MAMTKCPRCHQEVYDQATVCPYCGGHMDEEFCAICHREIKYADSPVLFHSDEKNADVHCCEKCKKQLDVIQESNDPDEMEKAINSIYGYASRMPGGEVKENLMEILSLNAPEVARMKKGIETAKPDAVPPKDYFAEKEGEEAGLFSHIGGKIKTATTVFCWIGIIFCVIVGAFLLTQNSRYQPTIGAGLGIMLGGSLVCWLSSLMAYGFGELIDEVKKNNRLLERMQESKKADEK